MSEKVSLQTNCDSVLIPCPARLSAIMGALVETVLPELD